MQFFANNLKTIAFSKILMGIKSVQHNKIYLCANFDEESLTDRRVMAFLGVFGGFLMFKIFSSETT